MFRFWGRRWTAGRSGSSYGEVKYIFPYRWKMPIGYIWEIEDQKWSNYLTDRTYRWGIMFFGISLCLQRTAHVWMDNKQPAKEWITS